LKIIYFAGVNENFILRNSMDYKSSGDKSNKIRLRKEFLKIRNSMDKKEIIRKSKLIFENIIQNGDFKAAQTVFCFLSFGSEVVTDDIISYCLENKKTVAVPKIRDGIMTACEIDKKTEFFVNKYGISEPTDDKIISKANIDLTIVPALVYNSDGFRIGYGGGFYYKFLSGYPGRSIGIIFKEFISDNFIPDENDEPVGYVITD